MLPVVERVFVSIPSGRVHVAAAGTGRPVLLLHQTPRSWDEFRDVLPLLGRNYRAIAMDTVGYGDSDPLPDGTASIERWAATAHEVLVALGHRSAIVIGHHTGAAIAVEMAASQPAIVEALVLSACPYAGDHRVDSGKPTIDEVVPRADGTHILELLAGRRSFYPTDRADLLERFVIDALKAGLRAGEGHRVVGRYALQSRLPLIRCPTLVIAPTADPHAYPHAPRVAAAVAGSVLVEIENGMVPLPDQMPKEFAEAVENFLSGLPD